MDKKNMTEYIKVNLPLTEQDYLAGNGEGVWVLVDPKTKQAHDTDATGGGYVGILDNDSCYYPGLNAGQLIPFELRGSYRPVANFYSFLSKLPRLTPEGKALLLERIAMYQAGHGRQTCPTQAMRDRFAVTASIAGISTAFRSRTIYYTWTRRIRC